jgi:signal peptidase II
MADRGIADRRLKAYGLSAAVFAVDRLSKWIIERRVSTFDVHSVIHGFFDIVHSQNRGVAFGLMNDSPSVWRTLALIVFASVAMLVVASILWRASRADRLTAIGLALILGGAAGNLFDRIMWGQVTDFLEFYIGDLHWPTFNVADSCVVIGSALLVLDILKPKRQAAQT